MEAAKQFDNLTWADLTIIDDELKNVQEFDIKLLKYRDLQIVCSQLKIKGVKNSMKEQIMTKFWRCLILDQQERSHSALKGC